MIPQLSIENKDFDQELLDISMKLDALGTSLLNIGYAMMQDNANIVLEDGFCKGYGLFIFELSEDLLEIHKGLYG